MSPGEYRLRLTYKKAGRLRWLSHLEVLRAIERAVRRSGVSYAVTQGFNPHMKLAFGPALPVGTAGEREYADVWLTRYTKAEALLETLAGSSAPDLAPYAAVFVGEKEPSLSAALTIGTYDIDLQGKGLEPTEVHGLLLKVIAGGTLEIEHRGKIKVFDLTQSVPKDPDVEVACNGVRIRLSIRMGAHGSLRPERLVEAALADTGHEVTAVRTTRSDLLVETPQGEWSRPV